MPTFNERAWRKLVLTTQFPVQNISGSTLSVNTLSGSSLTVSTASGSSLSVSNASGSSLNVTTASGSYVSASISSSAANAVHVALPIDHNIELMCTLNQLLEEQKKTNLYLSEIVGDTF